MKGALERYRQKEARKQYLREIRGEVKNAGDIQQQALSRAFATQQKSTPVPESHNRTYYYRNPKNPNEIKVINRIYNPYTKDWKTQVATNWHVAEPTSDMTEISQFHMAQLLKMKDAIPF